MITFILSAVGIYFLFLALDAIFRPRQSLPDLEVGQSIIQIGGAYYVVKETEPAGTPEYLPPNVVPIRANKK